MQITMASELTYIAGAPRLACAVTGSGRPVVFLHGIGGNHSNWRRQTAALEADFTTVAWDARGYGASEDYDCPLAFTDFADDLVRLLDQLNVERAHLIGLSMGARILMDFASRYDERVGTLTLCDCFYGFEAALSPEKQREYIELRERPLLNGKTFADLAPQLIDSLVSPNCSVEIREELRASILELRAESYLKTLRASTSFDRGGELQRLSVPVQLIFGEADLLTPPSIGEAMLDMVNDGRLAVLPRAGHLSNLEEPDAFNEVLTRFLAEHQARAWFKKGA